MDGHEETMTANLIVEYLFSQVDDDGNRQVLLDEIIDHRVDTKIVVPEKNAYLTAPCREKIYFIAGPELGSDQGKIMIIRRALYGQVFWGSIPEFLCRNFT